MQFFSPTLKSTSPTAADKPARLGDKCRTLPIPARLVSRAYPSLCDKCRSVYFSYYIFFGKQLPSEHIASCDKCRSVYYYFAPISRATSVARYLSLRDYVARFPLLCDKCRMLPIFVRQVSHAAYLRATSVARFPLLCDKRRVLPIPARLCRALSSFVRQVSRAAYPCETSVACLPLFVRQASLYLLFLLHILWKTVA